MRDISLPEEGLLDLGPLLGAVLARPEPQKPPMRPVLANDPDYPNTVIYLTKEAGLRV